MSAALHHQTNTEHFRGLLAYIWGPYHGFNVPTDTTPAFSFNQAGAEASVVRRLSASADFVINPAAYIQSVPRP